MKMDMRRQQRKEPRDNSIRWLSREKLSGVQSLKLVNSNSAERLMEYSKKRDEQRTDY
jgi:hypothetical protein